MVPPDSGLATMLIEHGAEANVKKSKDWTPLHMVVTQKKPIQDSTKRELLRPLVTRYPSQQNELSRSVPERQRMKSWDAGDLPNSCNRPDLRDRIANAVVY